MILSVWAGWFAARPISTRITPSLPSEGLPRLHAQWMEACPLARSPNVFGGPELVGGAEPGDPLHSKESKWQNADLHHQHHWRYERAWFLGPITL